MNYHLSLVCAFILTLSLPISNTLTINKTTVDIFTSGINRFSGEFYEASARNTAGNFISSPISALLVLAIATYGAGGRTRHELMETLHLPIDQKFIAKNFRDFVNDLNNITDIELHLANKLYINNGFETYVSFNRLVRTVFQSEIATIEFQDVDTTAKLINKWCLQATANKIKNIIKPSDIEEAALVMINAVYFKGNWMNPFNKVLEYKLFHLSEIQPVYMPMMCNSAQYNHGPLPNFSAQYIELPYKTKTSRKGLSMYIIIPRNINELDAISDRLHEINYAHLNSPRSIIDFCMPKYKIESELNLIPILQNMGIKNVFENSANFTNLTPQDNLKITKIIQKVVINVDETGSEAAATTGFVATWRMMKPIINVDRPFISAIVSKASGTPLFVARINDPRSSLD